jgi:ribosomal protein S18 acetylase RimI-like enzyme
MSTLFPLLLGFSLGAGALLMLAFATAYRGLGIGNSNALFGESAG